MISMCEDMDGFNVMWGGCFVEGFVVVMCEINVLIFFDKWLWC